jgi:hypothetical protein
VEVKWSLSDIAYNYGGLWVKYSAKFGSNDAWKAMEVGISHW